MNTTSRDEKIKAIIKLENRIKQCSRCSSLVRCTGQFSLGKGELEPQVMLVFEYSNSYNANTDWIINLRDAIKQDFGARDVYHTFLLRCQPKACAWREGANFLTNKLLDRNNICLLNQQVCDGVPIRPSDQDIIGCMPYLIEEIDVLQPRYVILFGDRVNDFVLKAYGKFDWGRTHRKYMNDSVMFISASAEHLCHRAEITELAAAAR